MEAFVSTGTRFNDRTVIESPVPIDLVTNLDLKLTGLTEPSQILQRLVRRDLAPAAFRFFDVTETAVSATARSNIPEPSRAIHSATVKRSPTSQPLLPQPLA